MKVNPIPAYRPTSLFFSLMSTTDKLLIHLNEWTYALCIHPECIMKKKNNGWKIQFRNNEHAQPLTEVNVPHPAESI